MSRHAEGERADAYGDPLPARTVCRIGSLRLSHPGVLALAFTHDSLRLASAGADEIRFWSVENGARIRSVSGGMYPVQSIAFDPTGNLAGAPPSGPLTTWSRSVTSPRYGSYPHMHGTVGWHGGAWLVRAGSRLYRIQRGRQETDHRLEGIERSAQHIAAIGGGRVAVLRGDGVIQLNRADNGAFAGDLFCGLPPTAIALGATGETLVAGFADGRIGVWDVPSERQLSEWPAADFPIAAVALSPDGRTIATGANARIRLWNAATGAEALELATLDEPPARLSFHPDAPRIVTRSGLQLHEWDAESGALLSVLPARGAWDDGNRIPESRFAVVQEGRRWTVWDVATGTAVSHLENRAGVAAVSQDGKRIALGGPHPSLRVASLPDGKEIWSERLSDGGKGLTFLRFLPDGSLLAGRTWEEIRLHAAANGRVLLELWGPVAVSRNGERIAAVTREHGIALWVRGSPRLSWQLESQHPGGHLSDVLSLAFAPFGRLLASACGHHVNVWRIDGRATPHHSFKDGGAHELVFSPDGRKLATVSWTRGDVLVRDVPPI